MDWDHGKQSGLALSWWPGKAYFQCVRGTALRRHRGVDKKEEGHRIIRLFCAQQRHPDRWHKGTPAQKSLNCLNSLCICFCHTDRTLCIHQQRHPDWWYLGAHFGLVVALCCALMCCIALCCTLNDCGCRPVRSWRTSCMRRSCWSDGDPRWREKT